MIFIFFAEKNTKVFVHIHLVDFFSSCRFASNSSISQVSVSAPLFDFFALKRIVFNSIYHSTSGKLPTAWKFFTHFFTFLPTKFFSDVLSASPKIVEILSAICFFSLKLRVNLSPMLRGNIEGFHHLPNCFYLDTK